MLLNIIFSYNRAMQVDYLLSTILKNLKIVEIDTVILYHTTGEHKIGYDRLIEKYRSFDNIKFIERKKAFVDISFFNTFYTKENIKFFLEKNLKNKNSDLFKSQLENLLRHTSCEFVMFNTDDGVYLNDIDLNKEVLSIFKKNPSEVSYRMYVGDNLNGFPNFVQKKNNHYEWDYYAEKKITHWTYPFSVDGTIYNTKVLKKVLKKIAYHNPITLEENGVKFIMKNHLFRKGLGPIKSNLIGTILNRVSTDSSNPTVNINVDYLNKKFIDGYSLKMIIPETITISAVIPIRVSIYKDDVEEIVYELDESGKTMQNSYGAQGSNY